MREGRGREGRGREGRGREWGRGRERGRVESRANIEGTRKCAPLLVFLSFLPTKQKERERERERGEGERGEDEIPFHLLQPICSTIAISAPHCHVDNDREQGDIRLHSLYLHLFQPVLHHLRVSHLTRT